MKMKIYALVSIIVVSVLALVIAQNQNTLKIFKAGDVIKAEDVNANFAALQAEIATLRSQIGNSNPSSNGYLGKFTQVIKQSDNFVCIPLLKDWKTDGCKGSPPTSSSNDSHHNRTPVSMIFGKSVARYIDNPLINNKPDVTIITQRNIMKTTYTQEFKNSYEGGQNIVEGYKYDGTTNVAYDSNVGKWYLIIRKPEYFLNCSYIRATSSYGCSEVTFDFLVFE